MGEYLDLIKQKNLNLNTSVIEIFLIFTKQLLDNQILLPRDVEDINIFAILSSSVTTLGQNQLKFRLIYISQIIVILLSSNHHLLDSSPNSEESKSLLKLKTQVSQNLGVLDALLNLLIKVRLSISDHSLI